MKKCVQLVFVDSPANYLVGFNDGSLYSGGRANNQYIAYEGLTGIPRYCHCRSDINELAAFADGGRLCIWNWRNGKSKSIYEQQQLLTKCSILSPGRYCTVDSFFTGRLLQWDSIKNSICQVVFIEGEHNRIEDCVFNTKTDELIFLCDFHLAVWDLKANYLKKMFMVEDSPQLQNMDGSHTFSKKGEYFFLYWDQGVLFETSTGKEISVFPRQLNPTIVRICDIGKHFAFALDDGTIVVTDNIGNDLFSYATATQAPLIAMDLSTDGKQVAFVDAQHHFGIIDIATGQIVISENEIYNAVMRLDE